MGISSIKSNETAVKSIFETLNKKDSYFKETSYSEIKKRNQEISNIEFIKMNLSNIYFSFRDGNQIMKNINLEFKKGEKIGIVGTTGSGKSSLVNIMMGLLEPSSGEIFFNDKIIFPSKETNLNIEYWDIVDEPLVSRDISLPQCYTKVEKLVNRHFQELKS